MSGLRRRIDLVIEPPPPPAHWIRQGDYPRGWEHGDHAHPFCQTLYVVRGSGTHGQGELSVGLRAGDLVIMPAGLRHRWAVSGRRGMQLFDCSVTGAAAAQLAERHAGLDAPTGRIRDPATSAIAPIVASFADEQHGHDPGHPWRVSGLLQRYLGEVLRVLSVVASGAEGEGLVERARRCIAEDYHQRLDLDGLAARVHVSGKHLCRLFAGAGLPSPMQLLERTRIRAAAELLRNGEEPVVDIARRVGYGDARLFARAFRRQQNMTPSDYRLHHHGE